MGLWLGFYCDQKVFCYKTWPHQTWIQQDCCRILKISCLESGRYAGRERSWRLWFCLGRLWHLHIGLHYVKQIFGFGRLVNRIWELTTCPPPSSQHFWKSCSCWQDRIFFNLSAYEGIIFLRLCRWEPRRFSETLEDATAALKMDSKCSQACHVGLTLRENGCLTREGTRMVQRDKGAYVCHILTCAHLSIWSAGVTQRHAQYCLVAKRSKES